MEVRVVSLALCLAMMNERLTGWIKKALTEDQEGVLSTHLVTKN
jgi:hypothetical protein